jgi:RNA polymerase sigma factor (sigma-70 family)
MEDPSRELIDAVVVLDESACTELIRRAEPLIRGAIAGLWFESNDDRDEVLQDIRIQVLKSVGRWDPSRGRFSTWLYGVAGNVSKSYLRRRRQRVPEVPISDPTVPDKQPVPERGPGGSDTSPSPLLAAFRRVYGRMSLEDQVVIDHMQLHADGIGGHTDLAARLRTSEGAAKQRVYRMKSRLKEAVEAELRSVRDLAVNKQGDHEK